MKSVSMISLESSGCTGLGKRNAKRSPSRIWARGGGSSQQRAGGASYVTERDRSLRLIAPFNASTIR